MSISCNPGIYLHIPFCDTKCGYCDFYSITDHSGRERFIKALVKEIELRAAELTSTPYFDTIYFGGGTPSILEIEELSVIFKALRQNFTFSNDCEITLETNPGTVDEHKWPALKETGINRLSIGIQSFDDNELNTLGRIHSSQTAKTAVRDARSAGFDNIGIDLIYALPGQSLELWDSNLRQAVEMKPQHISAYNLTYEQGTAFYRQLQSGKFQKHEDSVEADFFTLTRQVLKAGGYHHYEISNYAQDTCLISRHNYKYWRHVPFLAFGPSAFGYWENKRYGNVRGLAPYLSALENHTLPTDFSETLTRNDRIFEFVYLNLRTMQGLNIDEFRKRFHLNFFRFYQSRINKLLKLGMATLENPYFKLTEKGILLSDELLPEFAMV